MTNPRQCWQALVAEADERWPARVEEGDEGDEAEEWEGIEERHEYPVVDEKKFSAAINTAHLENGEWVGGYTCQMKGSAVGCGGKMVGASAQGTHYATEELAICAMVDQVYKWFRDLPKATSSPTLAAHVNRAINAVNGWWSHESAEREVCYVCGYAETVDKGTDDREATVCANCGEVA